MDRINQKDLTSRWWDFTAASLFMIAMLIAAARLVATKWVEELSLVETITFWGAITGLALGKSIFRWWVSLIFSFAYGIFLIPWQLGLHLFESLEWKERLLSMAGRIQFIIQDIMAHKEVTDNLLFLLLMGMLFWFLGVFGGYQLIRRGRIWLVILPIGLTGFVIHNFDKYVESRGLYIATLLFVLLVLLARMTYVQLRVKWDVNRTHVPPETGYDLSRFAVIITLVFVILAWNTPAFTSTINSISSLYQTVNRPWLDMKDRMSFIFSSLKATVGLTSERYRDTQPLGEGSTLSDRVVFNIDAPNYPYEGVRYYWKARVYDTYLDGIWSNSFQEVQSYSPDSQFVISGIFPKRQEITFKIRPFDGIITLLTPSQPVWISRLGTIVYGTLPDGSIDLIAHEANPFIRPGEMYEVRSSLPDFTQKDLREASTEYPDWIVQNYLQIPESITPRTRILAQRITEGFETPYDKAEAITVFLRSNIEYSPIIDTPPENQDVIDWFLFDYRRGFCNYYATAEIILLRLAGIPARWAMGYAEGQREVEGEFIPLRGEQELMLQVTPERANFVVRSLDAHSWPEVYFPDLGWVEFEPTVSQTPIIRPTGFLLGDDLDNLPSNLARDFPLEEDQSVSDFYDRQVANTATKGNSYIIGIVIVVGVFIAIAAFLFASRRNSSISAWWKRISSGKITPLPVQLDTSFQRLGFTTPKFLQRWAEYSLLSSVERAYLEINRASSRLGIWLPISATPSERVHELVRVLPPTLEPAHHLLFEYERSTYSTISGNEDVAKAAGQEIRKLSIRAKLEKITVDIKKWVMRRLRIR
jgi:transglutaminase-like putative cysteine protease